MELTPLKEFALLKKGWTVTAAAHYVASGPK
jgi:hypothetical protein